MEFRESMFPAFGISQVPIAQNIQCTKGAYFGVLYSATFHYLLTSNDIHYI